MVALALPAGGNRGAIAGIVRQCRAVSRLAGQSGRLLRHSRCRPLSRLDAGDDAQVSAKDRSSRPGARLGIRERES